MEKIIQYRPGLVIPGYKCSVCGKGRIKLWRLNNVMTSQQLLYCIDDAHTRTRLDVDVRAVQAHNAPRFPDPGRILVPAIPSHLKGRVISNYWRDEAVPAFGWRWWEGMAVR